MQHVCTISVCKYPQFKGIITCDATAKKLGLQLAGYHLHGLLYRPAATALHRGEACIHKMSGV
jgi:hypothetical protein